MRADGPMRWKGGRIYNPEDGRHYEASLTLKSANNLLVEGCVMFFCQSQVWRRADAARCPPVVAGAPVGPLTENGSKPRPVPASLVRDGR
jgi:hypothetical protein